MHLLCEKIRVKLFAAALFGFTDVEYQAAFKPRTDGYVLLKEEEVKVAIN